MSRSVGRPVEEISPSLRDRRRDSFSDGGPRPRRPSNSASLQLRFLRLQPFRLCHGSPVAFELLTPRCLSHPSPQGSG